MRTRELSAGEVDELYRKHPELNEPLYPREVLFTAEAPEDLEYAIMLFEVGGKMYLVKSDPYAGEDIWLEVIC